VFDRRGRRAGLLVPRALDGQVLVDVDVLELAEVEHAGGQADGVARVRQRHDLPDALRVIGGAVVRVDGPDGPVVLDVRRQRQRLCVRGGNARQQQDQDTDRQKLLHRNPPSQNDAPVPTRQSTCSGAEHLSAAQSKDAAP